MSVYVVYMHGICVYMFVYAGALVCVVCMYMCVYVCMWSVYLSMCLYVCISTCGYAYVFVRVRMCAYMFVCVFVCVLLLLSGCLNLSFSFLSHSCSSFGEEGVHTEELDSELGNAFPPD